MSQFVRVMLKILVERPKREESTHLGDCSSEESDESEGGSSGSNSESDKKNKPMKPLVDVGRSFTASASATRSLLARMNNYGRKEGRSQAKEETINYYLDDEGQTGKVLTGSPAYYNLIYGLCQMFEEIDINGDGTMEWTELMQFLLDTVNQRDKMTLDVQFQQDAQYGNRQSVERMLAGHSGEAVKAKKGDDDDPNANYASQVSKISGASDFSFISDFSDVVKAKKNLKHKFLADILQKFQRSKFTTYHESETLVDRMQHRSPIAKCLYSQRHGRFIMFEQKDPTSFIIAKEQMSQVQQAG